MGCKATIGELCSRVCSGGTPRRNIAEFYDGGTIPWLNTSEISFNRIRKTEQHITEAGLNDSSAKWIRENSVIVAMYGATAGKAAIAKIPLTTNQACCNLEINEEVADYRYIYYWFKNQYSHVLGLANGGAQQNLSAKTIRALEVELPSLMRQQQTANLLSSIDDKIEFNGRLNGYLEDYASCLFEDFASECISSTPLFEVANVRYGKGLATKNFIDSGYPVFGGNGQIGFYSKYLYEDPQILVSCRGAAAGNILVSSPKSFVTSNSLVIELNDRRYFEWLKRYFLLHQLHGYATGSAQPQITIDNLKYLTVPYPPLSEIEELTRILSTISGYVYSNEIENASLAQLRDTLLPKLMSGEIDVSKVAL